MKIKPILKNLSQKRSKVSKKRLKICKKCEHFIPARCKCEKCGCFMDYKTFFLDSSCPIGKWGKEE